MSNFQYEKLRGRCIFKISTPTTDYDINNNSAVYKPLVANQLVHNELVGYGRLPMLEVVCDSLVKSLSSDLMNVAQDNVSLKLSKIMSCRFSECISVCDSPAVFSIFHVEEWENYGLVIVEPAVVYSIVEISMGGKQKDRRKADGTSFTSIEKGIIDRFVKTILHDLSKSFSLICQASFSLVRTEMNSKFALIVRNSNASVLVQLLVKIGVMEGLISLVLPYATIEPIKDLLLQQFIGEKFGRDKLWEVHLGEELRKTEVNLVAGFFLQPVDLKLLASLNTSTLLHLDPKISSFIEIRVNDVFLFQSHLAFEFNNILAIID